MANYLVIKNGNDTKSYEAKTTHTSVPYLRVDSEYLDLTDIDRKSTTSISTSKSTLYYIGSENATYQTAYITSTKVSKSTITIVANFTTTQNITYTYTSNNSKSLSYDDTFITITKSSTVAQTSWYDTNSSQLPYNRVLTKGQNICTSTLSSTVSTSTSIQKEDINIDLKIKVNSTKYETQSAWYGTIREGGYTSRIVDTSYDLYYATYGIARVQTAITSPNIITTSYKSRMNSTFDTSTRDYNHTDIGYAIYGTSTIGTLVQKIIQTTGQSIVETTCRPKEKYTTTVSQSTSVSTKKYYNINYSITSTTSGFTTSNSDIKTERNDILDLMSKAKLTLSVSYTTKNSTSFTTKTQTANGAYSSIKVTENEVLRNNIINSAYLSIKPSFSSYIKNDKITISHSITSSRTRQDRNSTATDVTYARRLSSSYTITETFSASNQIPSHIEYYTLLAPFDDSNIRFIYRNNGSGANITYSDNVNLIRTHLIDSGTYTETIPIANISMVMVSSSLSLNSSVSDFVTNHNEFSNFTYTSNKSSFTILSQSGTLSMYTNDRIKRRVSYSVTSVNGYKNSTSTDSHGGLYPYYYTTTSSISTTISSTTEI